jgi:RNA polymerase sigma-70 factor (family 1)
MSDFTKLSEEELMSLLRQDQLSAFRELYVRHWKKLYADAYKRLKNKELAEEIVQEVFSNLWIKRAQLQINTTLGGYLHSAVSHYIIDQYRKEIVRAKYKEAFKIVHSEVDNSTEDEIMLKELTVTIENEVSQLPDKCRSVYELSRKEHKSNKEIALQLSISEKTVENHLTNALRRLRHGLSHYLMIVVILLLK